jgi:hypothetical protein
LNVQNKRHVQARNISSRHIGKEESGAIAKAWSEIQ